MWVVLILKHTLFCQVSRLVNVEIFIAWYEIHEYMLITIHFKRISACSNNRFRMQLHAKFDHA